MTSDQLNQTQKDGAETEQSHPGFMTFKFVGVMIIYVYAVFHALSILDKMPKRLALSSSDFVVFIFISGIPWLGAMSWYRGIKTAVKRVGVPQDVLPAVQSHGLSILGTCYLMLLLIFNFVAMILR